MPSCWKSRSTAYSSGSNNDPSVEFRVPCSTSGFGVKGIGENSKVEFDIGVPQSLFSWFFSAA